MQREGFTCILEFCGSPRGLRFRVWCLDHRGRGRRLKIDVPPLPSIPLYTSKHATQPIFKPLQDSQICRHDICHSLSFEEAEAKITEGEHWSEARAWMSVLLCHGRSEKRCRGRKQSKETWEKSASVSILAKLCQKHSICLPLSDRGAGAATTAAARMQMPQHHCHHHQKDLAIT